jgi:hypothetical protein
VNIIQRGSLENTSRGKKTTFMVTEEKSPEISVAGSHGNITKLVAA